jgi:hypothetical protein
MAICHPPLVIGCALCIQWPGRHRRPVLHLLSWLFTPFPVASGVRDEISHRIQDQIGLNTAGQIVLTEFPCADKNSI